MTGIGGDCFALDAPKPGAEPIALNGSGRAPAARDARLVRREPASPTIADNSPHAVTVPGAVDAWCRLLADHGTARPRRRARSPPIALRRGGLPGRAARRLRLGPQRRAPAPPAGDRGGVPARRPGAARAATSTASRRSARRCEQIAPRRPRRLLRGRRRRRHRRRRSSALGGPHTLDDFAGADAPTMSTPIAARYRGHDILECPPNGQGVAALMLLNMLERAGRRSKPRPTRGRAHPSARRGDKRRLSPARPLVADRPGRDAGRRSMTSCPSARPRSRAITPAAPAPASPPRSRRAHRHDLPLRSSTATGNAVSFINSLFDAFGTAHLAREERRHAAQPRHSASGIDPRHPNAIAPRKRPMHTIIPGMVMKDGRAVMPFGVMGGQYQSVGHAAFPRQAPARRPRPAGRRSTRRGCSPTARPSRSRTASTTPSARHLEARGHGSSARRRRSAAARRSGSTTPAASSSAAPTRARTAARWGIEDALDESRICGDSLQSNRRRLCAA